MIAVKTQSKPLIKVDTKRIQGRPNFSFSVDAHKNRKYGRPWNPEKNLVILLKNDCQNIFICFFEKLDNFKNDDFQGNSFILEFIVFDAIFSQDFPTGTAGDSSATQTSLPRLQLSASFLLRAEFFRVHHPNHFFNLFGSKDQHIFQCELVVEFCKTLEDNSDITKKCHS